MRIVKRAEFLLLPPGTVYSRYQPQIVTDFEIKGDSFGNDWYYRNLLGDVGGDSTTYEYEDMEAGKSLPICLDTEQRDGSFENDAMFLIYESPDLQDLVAEIDP